MLPTVLLGGASARLERSQLVPGHNIIATPKFVDAAAGDFRLEPGSPGVKAGAPIPLSDAYRAIHGVPLGLDLTGTPDMGALGSALVPPKPAPQK